MNALAFRPDLTLVLAQARLYERLADSAIEHRWPSSRPSRPHLFARAAAAVRRAVTQPAAATTMAVPSLSGYPYRG